MAGKFTSTTIEWIQKNGTKDMKMKLNYDLGKLGRFFLSELEHHQDTENEIKNILAAYKPYIGMVELDNLSQWLAWDNIYHFILSKNLHFPEE